MKNSTDNSHNSAKDLKQLGYVSFQFLTLGAAWVTAGKSY